MSKIISISGPSYTGKSSLIDELSTYHELSDVIYVPDIYSTVWADLGFESYKDVVHDYEYICVYILRLLAKYKSVIAEYKDSDKLVILDGCWIDISVYSIINMWYNSVVKEVQSSILASVTETSATPLARVYLTQYDSNKKMKDPYHDSVRSTNHKLDRGLEMSYYQLAANVVDYTQQLQSSDPTANALFIINDLKELELI